MSGSPRPLTLLTPSGPPNVLTSRFAEAGNTVCASSVLKCRSARRDVLLDSDLLWRLSCCLLLLGDVVLADISYFFWIHPVWRAGTSNASVSLNFARASVKDVSVTSR